MLFPGMHHILNDVLGVVLWLGKFITTTLKTAWTLIILSANMASYFLSGHLQHPVDSPAFACITYHRGCQFFTSYLHSLCRLHCSNMSFCMIHLPDSNHSYKKCHHKFRRNFPDASVPNTTTIYKYVSRFQVTGFILDRKRTCIRCVLR